MKNYIVYLLVMIVVICGCPVPSSAAEEPKLYAKAAVLMDADTGRVLYGRAPDEALPMASTTKIMTLILTLEYGNPDDVVTVSSYAAKMPEVRLGLHAGDRYVLQDLLYSMMLESHNDSACAVAEQVGGSVEAFAQMMNRKAVEIGLHDTYFITPNGLDAEDAGGVHHTTARDLAQLMRYCVTQSEQKEAFQAICQTRQYTFASCDGTRQFTVYNKNALLDRMDGVLAGKTGFTGNAGYCYVAAVNVGEKHFIVALLACGWPHNRHYKWADTRALLAYGDANYEYQEIKLAGVQIPAIPVADGLEPTISGTCEGKFTVLLSDSETVCAGKRTDRTGCTGRHGRHPAGIHRGHPACRISGVCGRNSRQKEFFLLYWNGIRCIFLLRSKRPFPSSMHIIEYRKEDVTAYAEYHCFRTRSADGECRRIFLSSWI